MGVRKQFCLRGHDTSVSGRNRMGNCKECFRLGEQVRSQLPEVKARLLAYSRRPVVVAQRKVYNALPEVKIRTRQRQLRPDVMILRYQKKAAESNLPFDLTLEQFTLLVGQDCVWKCSECNRTGVDRIDSSKGYTLDNCQSMCGKHNKMKMDFAVPELLVLAKSMLLKEEARCVPLLLSEKKMKPELVVPV